MTTRSWTHNDYTVGCVCALPKELIAVAAMLDETHPDLLKQPNDHNAYTLGRIGVHNIVVACLPKGEIGNNNAATVATRMTSTFPSIKFGLMVGIGGGVPKSVRLGDVVVSTPVHGFGGVVQWDFGKTEQGGTFKRTGALNSPPTELLTALIKLEKEHAMKGSKIPQYLEELEKNWPKLAPKYTRSSSLEDVLFKADCEHIENSKEDEEDDYDDEEEGNPCINCDPTKIIRRKPRDMCVHYGLIASGNQVIKDATFRDEINKRLGGKVLCFEMEAAGLMNDFLCIVVRGICDYADSHKHKSWQEHAAAVAAAFAKELLSFVPAQEVEQMPAIKRIESRLEGVSNTVKELRSHQVDQESQAIIDWITPVNYAPQQNYFIAQRQEGTGEWLLRSSEFKQWLTQSNQTLFCPGMPGAGKTIITSLVVHHLHNVFAKNRDVGIAYLYCNFRQQHEQRPANLIQNLLKQLVQGQPSIPEMVKNLYNQHKHKQTCPSLDELLSALEFIATSYSRTFIIIDALDECQISHGDRDIFLREIFNFQAKTRTNIFATSRFIEEIEAKFDKCTRLEIRASDTDVQKYLNEKLQNFPSFIMQNHTLQAEIQSKIIKAVDGILALKELEATFGVSNKGANSKALEHAYKEAMRRIQGQVLEHRELAMQVLSWIACAKRRLTSSELQHAIAVEINKSELDEDNLTDIRLIVSVCAGLVIVEKESNIVRLVHYTTQEYFERTWKDWFPNAQTDIARICVTYLSFSIFETGGSPTIEALIERLESNVLYDYAAKNWGYHASKSSTEGERLILDLLHSTAKVSACSQAMLFTDHSIDISSMTGLHLTAYFGLWRSMSALIDKAADIETKDGYGRTPLLWAARNGHVEVVKLLLDKDANIKTRDKEYAQTPLSLAAQNGYVKVVKLLLDKDANTETRDIKYGKTPLLWASQNGHVEVVKLLLDRDANTETRDIKYGKTPLLWASQNGHEQVLKLLLDKDANTETRDIKYGKTPLLWASQNGHEQVVKLLLDKIWKDITLTALSKMA